MIYPPIFLLSDLVDQQLFEGYKFFGSSFSAIIHCHFYFGTIYLDHYIKRKPV